MREGEREAMAIDTAPGNKKLESVGRLAARHCLHVKSTHRSSYVGDSVLFLQSRPWQSLEKLRTEKDSTGMALRCALAGQ